MRRIAITTLLAGAMTFGGAGVALARGHHHHHAHKAAHAKHHAAHHARHHAHRAATPTSPTTPTTGTTGTTPSTPTSTTTPTQTTTTATNEAGTVESFTGGVLTIKLAGGTTTVSGMVTDDTRIICQPAEMNGDDDNGQGDDDNGQGGGDQGDGGDHHFGGGDNLVSRADDMGGGDDQGDDDDMAPQCGESSLVAGAMVRFAELKLTPSGSVFESIDLITPATSTSTSSAASKG
ncbi:MAG: hypothetical protein FWD42_01275 [Solirubrobacterales bacterium]|nr:hypothetical protein [Solirubrobacterales bacterium]